MNQNRVTELLVPFSYKETGVLHFAGIDVVSGVSLYI